MNKHTILYDIIRNQVKGKDSFRAKVIHPGYCTESDIINEMVKRNATVTKQEAMAVISLYKEVILDQLSWGYTVSTGLFRAGVSLRGEFDSRSAGIDHRKHKAAVVLQLAKGVHKKIGEMVRFRKNRDPKAAYYIYGFYDYISGRRAKTLSAAGSFEIHGSGLKVYGYPEAEYLLTLVQGKTVIPLRIIRITQGRITALLPKDIIPGEYTLEYNIRYGTGGRRFDPEKITVTE